MKNLIHRIKFQQENHFIRPITFLLSKHLIDFYSGKTWPEQVIYVPSHPDRIRERGFCQTQIMTTHLIQYINELSGDTLLSNSHSNQIRKNINTHAQHTLTKKERQKSPINTYEVIHPISQHVALFDDVMTTGSTINACCRLLQKHGAKKIDIWTLARTPDHENKLDNTPLN
ncbi:phosphoribosyltransferase family protein [Marinomonas sp. C2222]|uniref:Phosphoribosyltransferase family protein n=1 Tax=Marinomonas sargassi TaxID=2984494 RepID=A0ABT2YNE3_9GAMM|nr:phosphoribosyltransferase family protein [Marinomonas sargassi]MCV2401407.1 phosphoribosyltransferase family protein [Marinomonas sargassi]